MRAYISESTESVLLESMVDLSDTWPADPHKKLMDQVELVIDTTRRIQENKKNLVFKQRSVLVQVNSSGAVFKKSFRYKNFYSNCECVVAALDYRDELRSVLSAEADNDYSRNSIVITSENACGLSQFRFAPRRHPKTKELYNIFLIVGYYDWRFSVGRKHLAKRHKSFEFIDSPWDTFSQATQFIESMSYDSLEPNDIHRAYEIMVSSMITKHYELVDKKQLSIADCAEIENLEAYECLLYSVCDCSDSGKSFRARVRSYLEGMKKND